MIYFFFFFYNKFIFDAYICGVLFSFIFEIVSNILLLLQEKLGHGLSSCSEYQSMNFLVALNSLGWVFLLLLIPSSVFCCSKYPKHGLKYLWFLSVIFKHDFFKFVNIWKNKILKPLSEHQYTHQMKIMVKKKKNMTQYL